jgi:hypothetical protein
MLTTLKGLLYMQYHKADDMSNFETSDAFDRGYAAGYQNAYKYLIDILECADFSGLNYKVEVPSTEVQPSTSLLNNTEQLYDILKDISYSKNIGQTTPSNLYGEFTPYALLDIAKQLALKGVVCR